MVQASEEAQRLDRFLTTKLSGLSRAYVQDLIAKGGVRVNGVVGDKGTQVHVGDSISVAGFVAPSERRLSGRTDLPIPVLATHEDYWVLDKPAGIPTHPNRFEDAGTLAHFLVGLDPLVAEVGEDPLRPGIVHRLDTDTSGLILGARNQRGFCRLRQLFDERRMKKTYTALVLGELNSAGEVNFDLAHHPKNPRKMVALVNPKVTYRSTPRQARTLYQPLRHFEGATLVSVKTLTGRMHQVRVHLAAIGHPLVGDALYQTPQQRSRDTFGLKRHFLHASQLRVPYEEGGVEAVYQSALAPELQAIVE